MLGRKKKMPLAQRVPAAGWPVWGLFVALCYLSGSRRARRTALRGLVGAALSAGVGAGLGRTLFKDGPALSSGTGTAAAFATAAALELGGAGFPVAALAGATFAARARSHLEGSVALWGGGAIGAAVTTASTRVWPLAPKDGPNVPTVSLPARAEPSEDGAGLVIAVNSEAGNGSGPTEELRKAFPRADVFEVDVNGGDELRKALDDRADDAVALGVAGGDGSVNTAAQVALDEEKVLLAVPAGTFNHLPAAVGIEKMADAVTAVQNGQAVEMDVATIDGRVFLNTASFGGYVEFVDAREKLERKIGKWPAVVVALVRVLRSYEPVRIEIDGKEVSVWMAFVGNCRYHPSGFAPSWRESLDDELLDVRYVDGSAPFARTRLTLAVLTGRLGRSRVYHQRVVQQLRIRSLDGPLRLARDGETFDGSDDILIEKLPKKLAVYSPQQGKP